MYSFTCFEAPKFKHLTEQTDTNYVLILVCIHARLTVCSADTTIFYFPHIGSEFIYRERFEQVLSYCVWRRHSSFRFWWRKCKVNFLNNFLLASYPCEAGSVTVKVHIYCFLIRSCNSGSLNSTLAKGKAILCFQSRSQRSATVAIRTVTEAGGAGLIFAQFPTKDVDTSWSKPCVQVDFITGTTILSYMEATRWVLCKSNIYSLCTSLSNVRK